MQYCCCSLLLFLTLGLVITAVDTAPVEYGGQADQRGLTIQEENNRICQEYKGPSYVWEPVLNVCVSCNICVDSTELYCADCKKTSTTEAEVVTTTSSAQTSSEDTAITDDQIGHTSTDQADGSSGSHPTLVETSTTEAEVVTTTSSAQTSSEDTAITDDQNGHTSTDQADGSSGSQPTLVGLNILSVVLGVVIIIIIIIIAFGLLLWKYKPHKSGDSATDGAGIDTSEQEVCLRDHAGNVGQARLTLSQQDTTPVPVCHPMEPSSLPDSLISDLFVESQL